MERERLTYLYHQYLQGTASAEEYNEWQQSIHDPSLKEVLGSIVDQSYYQILDKDIQNLEGNRSEEIYHEIISHPAEKNIIKKLWPKILIAAAIATMIASTGIWLIKNRDELASVPRIDAAYKNDIAPGKQGATLTLASGQQIRLSKAANGELAKESGVVVTKTANGELVYEIKGANTEPNKPNTLTTAKGETYQVRLPDGSLVWLNAASSLTYSAALYQRGVRRVKLDGEAYFEIAKDKAHPFIVSTRKQEVEVLGTHFNVNCYLDEPETKTSLLEGSVKINDNALLKPGEQAVTSINKNTTITTFNASKAIAWKNGKFVFEYEPIEGVMRKLGRWYDAEIIYQGGFSGKTFTGSISRFDNISKILEKITYTQDVHFKIEGRRITVMP
ncbi:MAG: FecR domain-containing protein [Janthinobacterium sp.]|jgi:hypothetical protein